MMMGNDGWMIDDVFWFCQCFMKPESSTLIWENGTLQESRICNRVSCLSSIVLYINKHTSLTISSSPPPPSFFFFFFFFASCQPPSSKNSKTLYSYYVLLIRSVFQRQRV